MKKVCACAQVAAITLAYTRAGEVASLGPGRHRPPDRVAGSPTGVGRLTVDLLSIGLPRPRHYKMKKSPEFSRDGPKIPRSGLRGNGLNSS